MGSSPTTGTITVCSSKWLEQWSFKPKRAGSSPVTRTMREDKMKRIERKYWVITDTHFGHERLLELSDRPKNYEYKILDKLDRIESGDVLIHLGDFVFGDKEKWNKLFFEALKGKAYLVKGNHDKQSDFSLLENGWDFVGRSLTIKRFGKKVLFSHMPQEWHGQFDLNLFGHFHNNDHRQCETELLARITPDKHMLIALEWNDYMPVTLKSLVAKSNNIGE